MIYGDWSAATYSAAALNGDQRWPCSDPNPAFWTGLQQRVAFKKPKAWRHKSPERTGGVSVRCNDRQKPQVVVQRAAGAGGRVHTGVQAHLAPGHRAEESGSQAAGERRRHRRLRRRSGDDDDDEEGVRRGADARHGEARGAPVQQFPVRGRYDRAEVPQQPRRGSAQVTLTQRVCVREITMVTYFLPKYGRVAT